MQNEIVGIHSFTSHESLKFLNFTISRRKPVTSQVYNRSHSQKIRRTENKLIKLVRGISFCTFFMF